MDLSENHQNELTKYVNFFTGKKKELISEINIERDDFKDDNVTEEFYNNSDVFSFFSKQKIGPTIYWWLYSQTKNICWKRCSKHNQNKWSLCQTSFIHSRRLKMWYKHRYQFYWRQQTKGINSWLGRSTNINDQSNKVFFEILEKRGSLVGGGMKLPSVGVGNDMQDKIIKLTAEIEKLKEKNATMQQDLLNAHKSSVDANSKINDHELAELSNQLKEKDVRFCYKTF